MSFRCVKLNLNWEPMEIVPWDKAFNFVYLEEQEKAQLLWTYPEEYQIRSQYLSWKYPSIIVLKGGVRRRPEKNVNPSLKAILKRDKYTCQYCGTKLSNTTGTRDHIIPKAKGGHNGWKNLVASCLKCQAEKADRHPDECNMHPKNAPIAPKLSERFQNEVQTASSFERSSWKLGFKKLGMDYLLGS